MTDQIADLLVRLRNASAIKKTEVIIPFSKMKESILLILKSEGFIKNIKTQEVKAKKCIRVELTNRPISHLKQLSKPGQKIYSKAKNLPKPLRGFGLVIISTPCGIITAKEATKKGVGGELICEVW